MKIVFTNNVVYKYAVGDPTANGGAERAQWLLAGALGKAGWSVTVGVRDHLAPKEEKVVRGVRFVGMDPANGGIEFLRSWSRFLESERPDWFYWRGADPLWGALLLIARTRGVRAIFAAAFDRDVRPRDALTRRGYLWPLYAWSLNTVERIFVQHTQQLSELNEKFHAKTSVIPGIVAQNGTNKHWAERGKYVVWAAVMRQPKRPDLLVEIARSSPEIRYVVCGGTSTHRTPPGYGERIVGELRSLPNVEYLGHVPQSQTAELIGNATTLLSTSDEEGFPNTFLEAWAAGTPVVSLNVDPNAVIREKGLGSVSGTVKQAVCDIQRLLESPDTFDVVSARARNYIQEVHSEDVVAAAFNRAVLGRNYQVNSIGECLV